jgi:hypothetical protein
MLKTGYRLNSIILIRTFHLRENMGILSAVNAITSKISARYILNVNTVIPMSIRDDWDPGARHATHP